jgi:hypothetical protein
MVFLITFEAMFKYKETIIAFSLILQIVLVKFIGANPEFIETYYSNGLYQFTSKLLRYAFGWLPFSFGDLFYAFSIIYIVRWLAKNRGRFTKDTKRWFAEAFSFIAIIYFAFHIFWGMNYYRLPLNESLNLEKEYTTEQLVDITKRLITKTNAIHLQITNDDSLKVEMPYKKGKMLKMAPNGFEVLEQEYPHLKYEPRSVKKSMFSLPLTYMGFSGYLNPLTNEAHLDAMIPAYKFPTTTCHEIAHQLGYAAENEANFIGCLASINNEDIYFVYSGYAFALRHCVNEIYNRDPELFKALVETINKGVRNNYKEVHEFWERYQNPTEPIFKYTYNAFLEANAQEGGMESYSYVVALIVNYFDDKLKYE